MSFCSIAGTGRTTGATGDDHSTLRAIDGARGVSAAQIRLAWTLYQGPHVLAIPGTGNPGHLTQNTAAGALRLSETELTALNAVPVRQGSGHQPPEPRSPAF